jgi:Kef-type K+ transport system membrane component KefB
VFGRIPLIASTFAEDRFLALALCLVVVVSLGRLVGVLFRKIHQPVVIGEILVGIVLGPTVLGAIWPEAREYLFSPVDLPFFRLVASVGLVLFMFVVGLEVDLNVIRNSGKRAAAISLTSIALPFALGFFVLGNVLHDDHSCVAVAKEVEEQVTPCTKQTAEVDEKIQERLEQIEKAQADNKTPPVELVGKHVDFVPFAIFIAVSMCVTAFPVLARILTERNMFKIPLGLLLIACAAIDDIMAFTLLALATALAGEGSASDIVFILGKLAIYVAILFTLVRPLLERFVLRPYRRNGNVLGPEQLSLLFIGLFASSYITSRIGVHELIGGFLFGVCVPRDNAPNLFHSIAHRVEGVSVYLLLPVFFVIAGQGVYIQGLGVDDILPLVLIILVACVGKFAGGAIAARVVGVPRRQSLAVGALMNTRGLTELVVLTIGRDAGVIDDKMYTMLVIMAIVTTAMAGPLLNIVYPDRWLHRDIAEAERRRISSATDRVAVVVRDPETSVNMAQVAAAYGGGRRTGEATLIRLTDPSAGLGGFADDLQLIRTLQDTIEQAGLTCTTLSRASANRDADVIAEITRLAPSAVVIDRADEHLSAAIRRTGADVLIPSAPLQGVQAVVVDMGGSNAELAALEMAVRVAMHADIPLLAQGRPSGRIARQLKLLQVGLTEEGAIDGPAATIGQDAGDTVVVQPGERDRIALADALAGWIPKEPLVLSRL